MKVLFLQDISGAGRRNEIKEVSAGYARNFLFAKKLARPATEEAIKQLAEQQKKKDEDKQKKEILYHKLIEELKNIALEFKVKMGERGKSFGSVTASDIQQALKSRGITVDKNWIDLPEHIKTTGEKTVPIKFPHNLIGEVKIKILPEE